MKWLYKYGKLNVMLSNDFSNASLLVYYQLE